ncbi:uncharacterized protein LOC143448381 isoform X2 [Clavelina lepadiformis]|uniref:uncharacterized protein LOC143448381 isoform X2 n=1 Tax=Clavelina lepadiformis TaxID=159417 RepID=UPI00404101D2
MSFGRSNSEFLAPPSASADSYRRHSWDGTTGKDSSLPDPSSTKTPHHCNGLLKNSLPESLEEAEKEHDIKETSSWWFNSWWRSPKGRSRSREKPELDHRNGFTLSKNGSELQTEEASTKVPDTPGHLSLYRRRQAKCEEPQNVAFNSAREVEAPKRRSGCATLVNKGNRSVKNTIPAAIPEDSAVAETDDKEPPATFSRPPHSFGTGLESRFIHQRRATVHYSSNGRPSLMDFRRSHYRLKAKEQRVLEQLKDICRDYVMCRLRQRNLAGRVNTMRPRSGDRSLSQEILFIGNELEKTQKCQFRNISKQIGITLRSEDVLRKVYFELAAEIITTEAHQLQSGVERLTDSSRKTSSTQPNFATCGSRVIEINWGRICALFAIAGGLAIDCVQQGHADLVNKLINYCGEFAQDEGVLKWIHDQGGWEALRDLTYEDSARRTSADAYSFTSLTNIALGFVACTIGAVLGAVAIGSIANI